MLLLHFKSRDAYKLLCFLLIVTSSSMNFFVVLVIFKKFSPFFDVFLSTFFDAFLFSCFYPRFSSFMHVLYVCISNNCQQQLTAKAKPTSTNFNPYLFAT